MHGLEILVLFVFFFDKCHVLMSDSLFFFFFLRMATPDKPAGGNRKSFCLFLVVMKSPLWTARPPGMELLSFQADK